MDSDEFILEGGSLEGGFIRGFWNDTVGGFVICGRCGSQTFFSITEDEEIPPCAHCGNTGYPDQIRDADG